MNNKLLIVDMVILANNFFLIGINTANHNWNGLAIFLLVVNILVFFVVIIALIGSRIKRV